MFGLGKFRRNRESKSSLDCVLECAQTELGKAYMITRWRNLSEVGRDRVNSAIDALTASGNFYSARSLAQKYGFSDKAIECNRLEAERHIKKGEFSQAAELLKDIDPESALGLWGESFIQMRDKIEEFKSNGKEVPMKIAEEFCISAYHLNDENSVLNSGVRGYRTGGEKSAHDYVLNVQQKRGMWNEAFRDNFDAETVYLISRNVQVAKTPEQIRDRLRNNTLGLLANKAGDESRREYFSGVADNLAEYMGFERFESAIDEDMRGAALSSYLNRLSPFDRTKNKAFSKLFEYGLARDALEFMDKSNCLEGVCGFSMADIAKLDEDKQDSVKKILMEYLLDKVKKYRNKKAFFEDSYPLRAIEASMYCNNPALAEKIFNEEYLNSDNSSFAIAYAAKAAGLKEPEVKYAKMTIVENESIGDFGRALYLCKYHGLDDLAPRYERIVKILKSK